MSSESRMTALLLVVVLALAGCVGIPTGGAVDSGTVVEGSADSRYETQVAGPRAGDSKENLLSAFLLAMRDPQNSYAVARQFLVPGFAETWRPSSGLTVRSGPPTMLTADDGSLVYRFASNAFIDADGRYSEETSNQELRFVFTKVDDEWRIADAPDGTVLSRDILENVFVEYPIYFFSPDYAYLVPEARWFPNRTSTPQRAVDALLEGPSPWLQQAVVSAFPTATTLGDGGVRSAAGETSVDLGPESGVADAETRERMRQQLGATLSVADVRLTVGGQQLPVDDEVPSVIVDPPVNASPLVGSEGDFGFASAAEIATLPGLGEEVAAAEPRAATLSQQGDAVALLAGDGTVAVVREDSGLAVLDSRPGLVAPTIDGQGSVWSVPASSPEALTVFAPDGSSTGVAATVPADSRIVAMKVSRDSTRMALLLQGPLGYSVGVAGIVRSAGAPDRLGDLVGIGTPSGEIIDIAWEDDRSLALLVGGESGTRVVSAGIGGPSVARGAAEGGVSIAGVGSSGLRVLTGDGAVLRLQGSDRWIDTGIDASFLGTHQ
jgi:hypothetical protein